MSDRSTSFTGIHFENPFLLSSAPPTESESNILRAFEAGWGGVVTKTIGLHPVVNVVGAKAKFLRTSAEDAHVSMKKRPGAALHSSWNWELISDKVLDWWLPRIGRIKQAFPDRVLIASIMAGSGNDKELRNWQRLARECQEAGADGLELNFSCPHMDRRDRLVQYLPFPASDRSRQPRVRDQCGRPRLQRRTRRAGDPAAVARQDGTDDPRVSDRSFS